MPTRGTKHRPIRVEDDLWEAFAEAAETAGSDRSTAVKAFIGWYCRQPGAKLPARPPRKGAGA